MHKEKNSEDRKRTREFYGPIGLLFVAAFLMFSSIFIFNDASTKKLFGDLSITLLGISLGWMSVIQGMQSYKDSKNTDAKLDELKNSLSGINTHISEIKEQLRTIRDKSDSVQKE